MDNFKNLEEFFEEIKEVKNKDICLDYNIIIELEELEKKDINLFKKYFLVLNNNNVYYSYGHLEELNTYPELTTKMLENRLNFIEKLTKNKEIIFAGNKEKFHKKIENVRSCYSRVAMSPTFNEEQDQVFHYTHKKLITQKINNVNNLKPTNFFFMPQVKKEFKIYLEEERKRAKLSIGNFCKILSEMQIMSNNSLTFEEKNLYINFIRSESCTEEIIEDLFKAVEEKDTAYIKEKMTNFNYTESLIEFLFNFLYRIEYFKEGKKSSVYRSKVFDVTHSIFATQMDYFVTSDKRLWQKIKVIYSFLGIKTELIKIK